MVGGRGRGRGRNRDSGAIIDIESELARVRARIEYIQARYAAVPVGEWSRNDQAEVSFPHGVLTQSPPSSPRCNGYHMMSYTWFLFSSLVYCLGLKTTDQRKVIRM